VDARTRLTDMRAVERLAARDATLFADPAIASGRLGWVEASRRALAEAPGLVATAAELTATGVTDVVVLGMGGSSLAALVLARDLGRAPGAPAVHVLDTSSPSQTGALLDSLDPASTLVIVSSKSGTSAEPLALLDVFAPWLETALGAAAGDRLVAITDPGSPLETLARERGFARVVHTPHDVGGRYAALTPFSLLPAALAGIDVARLAATAGTLEDACAVPSDANPALALAAWLGDAYGSGRDKLTVVCSPGLAAFGLWIEQLVAESTGKRGAGILPVLEAAPGLPAAHGADRMTFVLREADDEALAALPARLPDGEPVFEVVLDDPYSLAAEFVHWEWATALFCALEGIEPFDQPDVEDAKRATRAILSGGPASPAGEHPSSPDPARRDLASSVRALARSAPSDGFVAVLAYLPEDERLLAPLREACAALSMGLRMPVVLQLGPRYLHSTGQYFKGGPRNGAYLIATSRHAPDRAPSPGMRALSDLNDAQASGDASALLGLGLPVLSVTLEDETPAGLGPLLASLGTAAHG
jgi:transaldolase/glucose-6-phosphate isomerase